MCPEYGTVGINGLRIYTLKRDESHGSYNRARVGVCVRACVCFVVVVVFVCVCVLFPLFFQASPPARLPAALGGMSPTGLQGLMCMYNRLTAQGPSLPASLPSNCHPPASHPYNHSVHPTPPPPPQRPRPQRSGSHQPAHLLQHCVADRPVSSSRMMGTPNCRQTRDRPSDLVHDQQLLLPLLAQQGSDAPARSPSSSSAPRRMAATPPAPKWDGTGLPPPRWRPDGTGSSKTKQLPQQTGAAASAQSARRSAAAGVSAAAEQLHQIVTGITSLPAQASVQSATVTRATPLTSATDSEAALSSVLSQLNPTAAGAWVAGGTPVMSPAAAVAHQSVGAEMLAGAGCSAAVTRDQRLAMWNASTAWINAAQNAFLSPTTAAFAETSQGEDLQNNKIIKFLIYRIKVNFV